MAIAFFVDGEQLGLAKGFGILPTGAGSGSLYIGSGVGGALGFDGWIDNVQIFSAQVSVTPPLLGDINGDGMISGNGIGTFEDDDVVAFVSFLAPRRWDTRRPQLRWNYEHRRLGHPQLTRPVDGGCGPGGSRRETSTRTEQHFDSTASSWSTKHGCGESYCCSLTLLATKACRLSASLRRSLWGKWHVSSTRLLRSLSQQRLIDIYAQVAEVAR